MNTYDLKGLIKMAVKKVLVTGKAQAGKAIYWNGEKFLTIADFVQFLATKTG